MRSKGRSSNVVIRMRQAVATDIAANFQSINANGWSVTYASPPTFTPDSSPESFTVTRQGFTTSGAATTYTENLICTQRIRQVYPNQASLTSDQVALSDYVYSTDTVSGATNNSTETSPKPIANWAMFDRTVVGDTLNVELVAFHRNARNGEQVAAVEFRVTDGTSTVTQVVNTSSISTRYSSIGQKVIVYAASIDVSSLANPATLTVNAKVYPWIGGAASVLDSADQSLVREFSPRFFRRDTALLAAPRVAYVRTAANGGNDATGVVSTTPATASANPFATILAAINAHHTAGGMDGAIIYIGDCQGTPFALANTATTRTQSHCELLITREPGVARADAQINSVMRPRFGASGGWLRFHDITWVRSSTSPMNGEVASTLHVVLDNINYDGGSLASTITGSNANIWIGGVTFTNLASGILSSSSSHTVRCIRNCTATVPTTIEGFNLLGNTITFGNFIGFAGSSTELSIVAYNRLNNPSSSNRTWGVSPASGAAFVQNLIEYTSATGNPVIGVSDDNAPNGTSHVILHHNTVAGFFINGRSNLFYDDGATPRTNKLMSMVGNVHVQINNKSDVFTTDGTRVGNWAYMYGAGCRGEFSQFIDAENGGIGGTFAQAYPGLNASIGTSNSVRNDPLFTNYQGTTSGPTAGAGGGTYTLSALSPCKAKVLTPVLRFDIAGTTRSSTAATMGAYE